MHYIEGERLDAIQRRARESYEQRRYSDFIRRAGKTGSISGGIRRHAETARITLIAGGFLIAVIAGVALAQSNIGGETGLGQRIASMTHTSSPVLGVSP